MSRSNLDRRSFLRLAGIAGTSLALFACSTPGDEPGQDTPAGSGSADEGILRVGMEAAYAPYNWQTDTESEFTIPIDGIPGAFADGYDVQIARHIAGFIGREAVAVKLEWTGLIEAVRNGTIDVIIAGMYASEERRESIDFSDPYFQGGYGLLVRQDSEFADATSLADFSGAAVLGQKDTYLDEIIDDIPGVNHLTPVDSVPAQIARLVDGTCDAVTYNTENTEGLLRANPSLMAVQFAEGEGFQEIVTCSVGMAKGQEEFLAQVNEALAQLSEDDRNEMWQGAMDRQPA
ncbi:MAG: transporter substrate-binding domain-containing protein [Atopobiaceae bacterium]|nr:transporter substrate-binding domain-containing protein [Atopobiaceae bacterium]